MKTFTDSFMKLIMLLRDYALPSTMYRYKLGHINRKYPGRIHVSRYEVQPEVKIDVYWKAIRKWRGPGLSLFVHGDEVLRFDCFGAGDGHYHVGFYTPWTTTDNKIFLYESTVESQIERTIYELKTNLNYYSQRNPKRNIRNVKIDQARLENTCKKIQESMLYLLDSVPELRGLKTRE